MTTVETSVPDVIKYTSVVFASLSLLGSSYIFISSILHKRLRSFSFRMILWMCIFDAILGCATICGPLGTIEEEAGIENENGQDLIHNNLSIGSGTQSKLPLTCQLQAASIQFSILASLLWTLCFTIHLFRISSVNVNPNRTHSYTSLFIYLLISILIPLFLTYYIFAKDLVGVSSDFWCWINDDYLDEWGYKMLYIEVGVLVIILFLLYFIMKFHLKKFIANSNDELLNNVNANNNNHTLILNRSRFTFVRTISGGLSCYLFAPFISFIPAHFNYVCTVIGLESYEHVLSWYVLSGVLLGVLHIGIYICGISIVRYSWSNTCCHNNNNNNNDNGIQQNNIQDVIDINNNNNNSNKHNVIIHNNNNNNINNNNNKLQNSQKHYMELV